MSQGVQGVLKLDDAAFWTEPLRTVESVVEGLVSERFEGLILDGPGVVSTAARTSLPLVGIRASTTGEAVRFPLADLAVLAIVRLESNEVFVGRAFPWKPAAAGQPPEPGGKQGNVCFQFFLDAREQVGDLPWHRGTILTTLLLHEGASNRVRSRLVPSDLDDPEVDRFLEAQRRPGHPQPVWPRGGALPPSYARNERSLAPPAAPGIVLDFERVVVLRPGARCMLRGSFRLPVLAREIVKPPYDVADARATAVLPITLLLTSKTTATPDVIRLFVPSYDPIDPAVEKPVVTGQFELDLLALPGAPRMPESYVCWALSGETLAGPVRVALVSEEMLPPPGD